MYKKKTSYGDNALTPEKIDNFLKELAKTANVTQTAKNAKASRTTLYELKRTDEKFNKKWQHAWKLGVEAMEDLLVTTAEKNITALIFFLKGNKPEKYRDNVNFTGQVDLFSGISIERLISIAKRGCKSGSDPGGEK